MRIQTITYQVQEQVCSDDWSALTSEFSDIDEAIDIKSIVEHGQQGEFGIKYRIVKITKTIEVI